MNVELEHRPDYLFVQISGKYQGVFPPELSPSNLAKIYQEGSHSRILVDAREFLGTLGTMKRFEVAEDLTKTSPLNSARIAVVEDEERQGRVSFFETVAVNRGVIMKVFTDFDEALGWLME